MSLEERIHALESEVRQIKEDFRAAMAIRLNLDGQVEAYRNAILAVIASHPIPEALQPALEHHLLSIEANSVGSSTSDEFVKGVQDTSALIRSALDFALEQRRKQIQQQQ